MRDMLLQSSGVAAIAAALVHGLIGELKIFPRITIEPARLCTLIRLVWQAGTVAWIGCGVLLIAAPSLDSEPARHWIVITLACVFAFAALANAWATRGRHFGCHRCRRDVPVRADAHRLCPRTARGAEQGNCEQHDRFASHPREFDTPYA